MSTENWEKDHQKDIEPDFNVNADICVQVGVGAEADDSIIFFAEWSSTLQEDDQHDKQDERAEFEGEGLQKPVSQRPWHGRWPKVWFW